MGVVGYFTAEIGLWSELHTYSGGLGVLAGDHVKSAADAEIPLVGVTLVYRKGTEGNIWTRTESNRNLPRTRPSTTHARYWNGNFTSTRWWRAMG